MKRGVPEARILESLKRAALNVGQCSETDRELPPDEIEAARKSVSDMIELVKSMSPAQRMLARAILHARAAARSHNN